MIDVLYEASGWMLAIAATLTLIRLLRGPSIFDRVLAVDTLSLMAAGYLLMEGYFSTQRYYSDAALGLALFAFVGTVAFGVHLQRQEFPDE